MECWSVWGREDVHERKSYIVYLPDKATSKAEPEAMKYA